MSAILAHYPLSQFSGPPQQGAAMLTDGFFACSARQSARGLSAHGSPTFLYQFAYAFDAPLLPHVGAAHSVELPFVFGTTLGGRSLRDDEQPLSSAIMGYWTRFAATGDPNGGGAPAWPAYDVAGDANVVLDATITTAAGLKRDACDFWDGVH